MNKADVVLKGVYVVKVSGRLVKVRVDRISVFGGWYGTNLATGREVRIRSAARLRQPYIPKPAAPIVGDSIGTVPGE